jgi:hypothetical protein
LATTIAVAVIVGVATSFVMLRGGSDEYTISIGLGLTPKMGAQDVAAVATAHLSDMAQRADRDSQPDILSITAVHRDDVSSVLPHLGPEEDPGRGEIQWVVKAYGWFVSSKPPPGSAHPTEGPAGYLRYDDASGELIGMGISADYVK